MINPHLRSALLGGLKFGFAVHFVGEYFVCPTMTMGPSMLPTFNSWGDWLLMESVSPKANWVGTGDVVIAVSPDDPEKHVCKRIVGMAGDIVCVDPTVEDRKYIEVPKGHVWLQGDNMTNSTDSRTYGAVPYAMIRSKVFCRIWPEPCWVRNTLRLHLAV